MLNFDIIPSHVIHANIIEPSCYKGSNDNLKKTIVVYDIAEFIKYLEDNYLIYDWVREGTTELINPDLLTLHNLMFKNRYFPAIKYQILQSPINIITDHFYDYNNNYSYWRIYFNLSYKTSLSFIFNLKINTDLIYDFIDNIYIDTLLLFYNYKLIHNFGQANNNNDYNLSIQCVSKDPYIDEFYNIYSVLKKTSKTLEGDDNVFLIEGKNKLFFNLNIPYNSILFHLLTFYSFDFFKRYTFCISYDSIEFNEFEINGISSHSFINTLIDDNQLLFHNNNIYIRSSRSTITPDHIPITQQLHKSVPK